jgi:hypothetical protein
MTNANNNVASTPDRVKLPFSFDAAKMQADIQALELRNADSIPLRGPAHIIDPTLTIPPPTDDYPDDTRTEWKDTSRLQQSPYLKEVVDFFKQNTRVTLVRILRLAPGAEVQEHTDPTLGLHIERSVIRPTIPVFINDKVPFHLNGKPLGMQQGECWYLEPYRSAPDYERKLRRTHQHSHRYGAKRVNPGGDCRKYLTLHL